jgi:putative tryptophan/tyrosine transport system substrate-binding protein
MRRREFITLLGGAAVAWPVTVRAQRPVMQVIGLLNGQPSAASASFLAAFRQGLAESGFVEGRNLAIVYRSSEGNVERLPALAAELVSIPVAVIAAVGGDESVLSAKSATATVPIVFTTGGDPIDIGIVPSLSRPGGNITGATFLGGMVATKEIGLLRDLVPKLATLGLLLASTNAMTPSILRDVQAAAQSVGLKLVVAEAASERDIDKAFARLVEQRVDALLIGSGIIFYRYREGLATLAARHAIPSVFSQRDFAAAGGLMSYGADTRDAYRQAGIYVARILKGDKPADLPVMQAAKFELVINVKTAKALGLTVPSALLAIADEVIE